MLPPKLGNNLGCLTFSELFLSQKIYTTLVKSLFKNTMKINFFLLCLIDQNTLKSKYNYMFGKNSNFGTNLGIVLVNPE